MAIVILKKAGLSGGFQTVGTREVKKPWLVVSDMPLKSLNCILKNTGKDPDGYYLLKAVMMNGNVFESRFADRTVFASVFNRNRTLQGVAVFFDHGEVQAVGELTGHPLTSYVDRNGEQIHIGNRVEIPCYTDLWMRGAQYGVVTKIMPDLRVKVCLDKLNKRYSFLVTDCKHI